MDWAAVKTAKRTTVLENEKNFMISLERESLSNFELELWNVTRGSESGLCPEPGRGILYITVHSIQE